MKRSKLAANVLSSGKWAALVMAGCLFACEDAPECSPPRGVDQQPLVRGRIDASVSGAEAAPVDFVLAARSTSAESVTLSGCGQSGDVPWYLDLGVSVPVTRQPPAELNHEVAPDASSGDAGLRGSIVRCDQGACGSDASRLFFGAPGVRNTQVEGVVQAFDPVAGMLQLTAEVTASDSGTRANLDLDITWNSPYEPTITQPLTGRWGVKAAAGAEFEPVGLELTQDGVLFTGALCDEAFASCEADALAGELSDPWLRFRWSTTSNEEVAEYALNAVTKDGGKTFEGTLTKDGGEVVNVLGTRVETE